MQGPTKRLIQSQGVEYTVQNATGGDGGRSTPSYSGDGSVLGVLEQRGMPQTATDSDGTDIETNLELRVIADDVELREAGSADGSPSKLEHPSGQVYRVLAVFPEDSGVTVLTVVRD